VGVEIPIFPFARIFEALDAGEIDAALLIHEGRLIYPERGLHKVVDLGPTIVLDQERCILCTRCIRVCDEVAGVHQLEMSSRGDHELLGTAPGHMLDNPYSLNTVDVCPVGALTAKDFRFTMRAWELYATPSVCTGCATGCNTDVHSSRGRMYRIVPRTNEKVNKHWMCDEGRMTYKASHVDRLAAPMSEGAAADWDRALDDATRRLRTVIDQGPGRLGVVFNATSPNEDLYALAKLAFDHLGVGKAYLAGRDQGWSDKILVSADKNPNTAGAAILGLPSDAAGSVRRRERTAGARSRPGRSGRDHACPA